MILYMILYLVQRFCPIFNEVTDRRTHNITCPNTTDTYCSTVINFISVPGTWNFEISWAISLQKSSQILEVSASIFFQRSEKEQLGNDQQMAQSERKSHSTNSDFDVKLRVAPYGS